MGVFSMQAERVFMKLPKELHVPLVRILFEATRSDDESYIGVLKCIPRTILEPLGAALEDMQAKQVDEWEAFLVPGRRLGDSEETLWARAHYECAEGLDEEGKVTKGPVLDLDELELLDNLVDGIESELFHHGSWDENGNETGGKSLNRRLIDN